MLSRSARYTGHCHIFQTVTVIGSIGENNSICYFSIVRWLARHGLITCVFSVNSARVRTLIPGRVTSETRRSVEYTSRSSIHSIIISVTKDTSGR